MKDACRVAVLLAACGALSAACFWMSQIFVAVNSPGSSRQLLLAKSTSSSFQEVSQKALSCVSFHDLIHSRHPVQPKQCLVPIQGHNDLVTWVRCQCDSCIATATEQLLPSSSLDLEEISSCSSSSSKRWAPIALNETKGGISTFLLGFVRSQDFLERHRLSPSPQLKWTDVTLFLLNCPVISLLLCMMTAIFVLLWQEKLSSHAVVSSASSIFQRFELWRIVSAALSHQSPLHFAMNMLSLCNLAFIEPMIGSHVFFSACVFFIFGVEMLDASWRAMLSRSERQAFQWDRPHLGFSGVLFAWMMIATSHLESFCPIPFIPVCIPTLKVLSIKLNFGPLLLVGLIQLLVPMSSFIGHCAGILLGCFVLVVQVNSWPISASLGCILVGIFGAASASAQQVLALGFTRGTATVSSAVHLNNSRQLFETRAFVEAPISAPNAQSSCRKLVAGTLWCALAVWAAFDFHNIQLLILLAVSSLFVLSSGAVSCSTTGGGARQASELSSPEEIEPLARTGSQLSRPCSLAPINCTVGNSTWVLLHGHAQWIFLMWVSVGGCCVFEMACEAAFVACVWLQYQITAAKGCGSLEGLLYIALLRSIVLLVLVGDSFQRTVSMAQRAGLTPSAVSSALLRLSHSQAVRSG